MVTPTYPSLRIDNASKVSPFLGGTLDATPLPNLMTSSSSLWRKRKGTQATLRLEKVAKESGVDDLCLAPEISDKYVVKDLLGSGSMAVVYRASVRGEAKKEVALKVLKASGDPEMVQLARQEFELLKDLPPHPHIIQAFDFHEVGKGGVVLALEFFNSLTLQQATVTAPDGRLPLVCVRLLSIALFQAVSHLHHHEVIHRDIKPSNIFTTKSHLDFRLADFNVAKSLQDGASLSPAGDPIYRSPEVANGAPCSEKSDVWSSGLSVFFALFGALPQQRQSQPAAGEDFVHLPRMDLLPPVFQNSLRCSLSTRARHRPTAAELAFEDAWALSGL